MKIMKMMSCVVNSVKVAEQQQQLKKKASSSSTSVAAGSGLAHALRACVNSSVPPLMRTAGAVRQAVARCQQQQQQQPKNEGAVVHCCITGAALEDQCIEVRAASKGGGGGPHVQQQQQQQNPPVVVHCDFEHFFHMLWYCSKIEHVVRHMGKCWMEDNPIVGSSEKSGGGDRGKEKEEEKEVEEEEEDGIRMQAMCEQYSKVCFSPPKLVGFVCAYL